MYNLRLEPVNPHRTTLCISTTDTYPSTRFKEKLGCTWHSPYYQEWRDDIDWYRKYHYRISDLMASRLPIPIGGYDDRHREMLVEAINQNPDTKYWYNSSLDLLHTIKAIKDHDTLIIDAIISDFGITEQEMIHRQNPNFALKPWQKEAISLYIVLGYADNWGQMRTGKTPPTIVFNWAALRQRLINTCLVVCTASNKWTWYRELDNWCPEMVSALSQVIEGTKAQREELLHRPGLFKIINYDSLKASLPEVMSALKGLDWSIALDEVHHIKNQSQRTMAVQELFGHQNPKKETVFTNVPKYAQFLSGTPVANTPVDVYRPVELTAPGLLAKSMDDFEERYLVAWDKKRYKTDATKEIHGRMARCSVRATRKECDLEIGLIYEPQDLEMSETQAAVYESAESILRTEFLSESGEWVSVQINSFLARLQKLIQITDGFIFTNDGRVQWLPEKDQPKLQWLLDYVSNYIYDIEKLTIFSRFTPVIDMLQYRLKQYGLARIDGTVKAGVFRDNEVHRFTTDPSCRIMLMNPRVAEGSDLNPCSFMVHYDRMFYLKPNEQADTRATGMNQKEACTIMELCCDNPENQDKITTIDQALAYTILPKKRRLAAEVMGDGGIWENTNANTITKEDIAEMLGV